MSEGTLARLYLTVWMVALGALCWLLAPGDWRGLAAVPLLGIWAVWALPRPRGAHSDRAALGLSSPEPGIARSMILEEELAALGDWAARYEIPEVHVYGSVSGSIGPPWEVAEEWRGHDDPWHLPENAGAVEAPPTPPAPAHDSTGPGALIVPTPGPVEPTRGAAVPVTAVDATAAPRPEPSEDTAFRAGMAADVLTYERAMNADTRAWIAEQWDGAVWYLSRLVRELS